ncbi:LytR/AlgR family response regulator transcription factor [Pedobacter fastidiosus]|uniref:Response regulator transcription factor n=1 Tax=Pedobacter fastidiosus TaxID=2765361 RepID=A0ABR7KX17_9SPHI|nr:LytTR family DNA-binding domain-containing protein [Pedobacter fastidiosus]MBC6112665.1 response regulator transcription factor [Pedobacter fastidiosus]
MLKAIIIDDEPDCVKLLALQLKMYCKQVDVIGEYTHSEDGLLGIKELQPDLVFLDIEMPMMNGFQLLEKLGDINFSLVFVTAYDQFAVKAFRFSALDYLLKPIAGNDLTTAVKKAEARKWPEKQQLEILKQQLKGDEKIWPEKIALPFQNGVTFVELKQLIYCKSDNNYTHFYLADNQQYTVAKTLGDIQEILEERNFLRVHRQYLINLDHIKKYVRGEGNYLILSNGQSIPVARNQKERLIEKFGWL